MKGERLEKEMREKRGNWGETERLVGSVQSNGRGEETRGRQEDW